MDTSNPSLPVPRGRRVLQAANVIAALIAITAAGPQAQARELRLSRLSTVAAGLDASLHGGGTLLILRQGPFAVCPVDPPRHYVDDFGAPRYAGGFHRHEGIDIFAPRGTPIRAPFAGRAETSTSWAGGIQVYVYGRDGFAFNAHLTRVGRLGKVTAGTIVGYVGNGGDALGGSTHDHFEWHPHGGPAVDSFRSLNAVCAPARRSD